MPSKKIMCKDARAELLAFINENFDLLEPFEVKKGFGFSIELTPEQYAQLTGDEKIKLSAYQHGHNSRADFSCISDEVKTEWLKSNLWKNTNTYIFHFHTKRSYVLHARCEYGPEDMTDSVKQVFINTDEFPELIMLNIDKRRDKEWRNAP